MNILSLPKHENLTTGEKYCGKEEKLLLKSNFSSFPQYFHCISNFKSPIKYKFVKCGCSNYFYLNSANLIYRGMAISTYFRESIGIRDNESRLYVFCLALLRVSLNENTLFCLNISYPKPQYRFGFFFFFFFSQIFTRKFTAKILV